MKKLALFSVLFLMLGFLNSQNVSAQGVKLKSMPKPTGKSRVINSSVSIPRDWVYVYDKKKGYGFSVPGDSVGEASTVKGVDLMTITTPTNVDIFMLAFKDRKLTKDDLVDFAIGFLEGLDQQVTEGDIVGESEDYLIVNADTVHPTLGKGKLRIMVATDITDNYIMILGANDKTFKANENLIDLIWGSFEMWSGGASGKN